ncbi:hypothetical protein [Chryseobacterium sp. ERMR1:04]|uniref:hypothetical protein n=1 Tax=Chryseobacterium sp. ERMR1:04 TaxID=1705393 RepID=UPI0006C85366|nr:hypothetical protein [Chryseobacterium sp. ERMR1:04]KPH11466.1 hypothetical protein AMQ68_18840 [Chryseobacterium sp. ERMR1:04]
MFQKIKNRILNYLFNEFKNHQNNKQDQYIRWIAKQFKKVGSNFQLETPYIINGCKYIEIGSDFVAGNRFWLDAIDHYRDQKFNPEIIIKDNVHINHNVHIGAINKIVIGNNTLIASNVLISDHNHGSITKEENNIPPKERPLFSKGEIIIGDNVWIGEYVSILGGVKIGNNVIIGSNSLINKDIPDNCVVGGVPAKILKTLE